MRKLTILMVVVALLCAAVVVTVPALCHHGSDGGSCDVVSMVRGGIRLANGEICKTEPVPVQCAVTSVAGLDRK